tara:strand:- start:428 stop:1036 length:609 start_codon:yes stop_codon:yes gene_type:complete
MTKGTKDGQNVERVVRKRYAFNSGQDSIHGSTLFQAETQESQSFGFYGSTGQGASEGGGPGTGKAVLYTPGMSQEILGQGLKVRGDADNTLLLAKLIECEKGDQHFECKDGNITIRARQINLDASDQIVIKGDKKIQINTDGDIVMNSSKTTINCTKDMNVIVRGVYECKYGLMTSARFADERFGALTNNIAQASNINLRSI